MIFLVKRCINYDYMNESNTKLPAVFVDRDGTLIEEVDHLATVEELRIFPFTAEAVGLLKESGYLVIVVTNQSGIGRAYFDESSMHKIHDRLQHEMGGKIDGFYFCPHLPDAGCTCRKPGTGMIESACSEFAIDLSRSWIIGDKVIDVKTGHNAGIRTALVLTGYGTSHRELLEDDSDIVGEHFLDAVKEIVRLGH